MKKKGKNPENITKIETFIDKYHWTKYEVVH